MITFLDENDVEYGALATIKATNAVNGERSLTGTIVSGDYVLSKIERGWRLRFDDEYYVVTYAKPIDEGRDVQVEFDAVHQFFWDFDKSSVYDQLADGSHTFIAYLDFIFKSSGYSYTVDSALNVHAFEKQSFGFKKRLTLFNDIITSTGVEFQVNGKVVRILEKVGTDLSTVVRKNFNMNELTIEKNIGDFVTYQKGFGAYFDEEDHSKGRLEVEYTSPLASVYGRLEAEPFVDERYSQSSSLLAALKENVDNSYSISVSLDMEDLTRAGYKYKQPIAGDYIMAINETLGFKEKIRIVSFTSEYAVDRQLIKHTVTCNDIGSVKKLSASYTHTQHQAANAEVNANTAYEFANKALVSADGKNTNYYGDTFPVDNPKGTLKKGDLLFLTVGDTVKQYYWNGADWVINPVLDDVEAFKEHIAEELKDVPNREEFENKIAEELATSKAEIETQIETAKTQAESNAKEYADTINDETAKVAELANAAAGEIKADLVNVKNNLTETSLVANNAQAAVDAAKQELAEVNTKVDSAKAELTQAKQQLETVRNDSLAAAEEAKQGLAAVNTKVDSAKAELTQTKQQLTTVADDLSQAKTDLQTAVSEVDTKATNLQSDLSQAKQDLTSQAQQLQAQANAQSELTKRVSSVEETANGTKTTVSELSKTVDQNGKEITSVTARTKVVEDDLAGTKTTLSQVQTTANSNSQKTAILETGLNGLTAKFNSLKIGGRNLLTKTNQGKTYWGWAVSSGGTTAEDYDVDGINAVKMTRTTDASASWSNIRYDGLMRNLIEPDTKYTLSFDVKPSVDVTFWAELQRGEGGASLTNSAAMNKATANKWTKVSCVLTSVATLPVETGQIVYLSGMPAANGNWLIIKNIKLEKGNVATDYSPSEVDFEQKVAEYKQSADQNYASLQTTVQNLDGTVQHNKTVADQTAQGFTTRIESLETYKDGESERANAYFESAKTETAKQLTAERTAIAKDYVAKSTYTSDVTGIRNDLTATTTTANTTKTNLANYQASNDKVVASLKSSLQTTDGNVSNLQTKVEAVPGQITSAVSAVEGKIPTSIGGRNLWIQSKVTGNFVEETLPDNHVTGQKKCYRIPNYQELYFNIEPDFSSRLYRKVTFSAWVKYENVVQGDNSWNKFNCFKHELVRKNSSTGATTGTEFLTLEGFSGTSDWKHITYTYDYAANKSYDQLKTSIKFNLEDVRSGTAWVTGVKVEIGSIPSDYSQAPEDTAEQISNLSSEIKQTADGMTLLATKTELNAAKNELQSGVSTATDKANNAQTTANNNAQTISTHTTQISALNTGLSAKVSQTDFNTLSGRVTTAENNITAKANELSSKITSVEGKIPTSIGGRNLLSKTNQGKTDWSWAVEGGGTTAEDCDVGGINAVKLTRTSDSSASWDYIQYSGLIRKLIEPDTKYTLSFDVKPSVDVTFSAALQRGDGGSKLTNGMTMNKATANQWAKVSCVLTSKATLPDDLSQVVYLSGMPVAKGNWLVIKNIKLEKGVVSSDWSPAPEDTSTQISSLSSQIQQTADGMTLLATKTELNSAKTELQSGISTATNKANAAQSTANNNAQTISTHTTQISALNTGLSAKVSQSDFNTLSGRVTTAENNITAKANELSSKITAVEGAIEDTQSDITKLSSEIKQTADGMTMLATKTELNTAKSDLQSGINTATNKANAAQSTANNNAQTISTHTTQISALNTGLQAKVSQSDFNTLSGRVTTAENNIIAKANELSSKISSVEGKIPTTVGGRNLLSKTNQGKTNWSWNISSGGATLEDFDTYGVNAVKMTRTSDASVSWSYIQYSGLIRKLIEPDTKYTLSFDVKPSVDVTFSAALQRGDGGALLTNAANMNKALANKWTKVSCVLTSKATLPDDLSQVVYLSGMPTANRNWLIIKNIKLEKGVVSSDWSPAPEDTATQISNLSSEIKQTADGMTLLATKTELNTAKNELQSGINTATNKANNNAQTISTHTTQISALNTGLSAKVSQTEFNTLSGRVTTAENNITAKANELSSKISSVESKIPTNLDSLNLMTGTRDWSTKANPWHMGDNWSTENVEYQGLKVHSTQKGYNGSHQNIFVKNGDVVTFSFFAKATNTLSNIKVSSRWNGSSVYQAPSAGVRESDDELITITSEWKRYSKTVHIISDGSLQFRTEYNGETIPNGNTFYVAGLKLAKSSQDTGYSENPTDVASDISAISSELKQTADGMTLLATKTELSTAKSDLQSGISTATNKANAAQNTANSAQSTANSNAQTISTHTTQISALNTGLQAKVSQTDFNTLSGRVTTAENNITAKANELSSKITSVEGKIPTSVGGRNLLSKTNQGKTNWDWTISSGGATIEDFDTYGVNAVKMTRKSDAPVSWSYIQYSGLIRKLIEPDTKYTLSFDVYPTQNVTFSAALQRGDGGAPLTNAANMNNATANQWTKVSCVLTSKTTLPDDLSQVVYLSGMPVSNGNWLIIKNIKLEEGVVSSDWSPAPEDYDSKLSTVQSEFKQTTDAIKASVQSLDNNTVKSSSLTINSDGIVMKAGKTTTDVANAIGSYFAVNQNAINLFSDKINVKGNMIVNGAITSDKIASKQINTAHLNGKIITADVISSNAVTADAIKAGAVTTDKMSANSINGDRIAAGTLDAAKIKAGSITASQIASGTITSNQIKAGGISSANIAAGAITGDKIAAGAIDANKIAANAITANMIRGGQLNSTNGATVFDLNAGTLTFNNNYGYIQRVASDKVFEITTNLGTSSGSREYLTSAFKIRKSDFSRKAGAEFTLFNTLDNKPTAQAKVNADSLTLYDSQNTMLFSMDGRSTYLGSFNIQGWGDIPIARVNGGLIAKDVTVGGHTESLLKIVEELCKKTGILWV